MDEFVCLRPLDPNMFDDAEESSSEEGEDSDDEEDEYNESDEGAEDDPNDIPPRGEQEECEVEEQTVNMNTQVSAMHRDTSSNFDPQWSPVTHAGCRLP